MWKGQGLQVRHGFQWQSTEWMLFFDGGSRGFPEGQQGFPGMTGAIQVRKKTHLYWVLSPSKWNALVFSSIQHWQVNFLNPSVWPLSNVPSKEIWFIITQCQSQQNHRQFGTAVLQFQQAIRITDSWAAPEFLMLGWGSRICISNIISGDADAAGLETREMFLLKTVCLQLADILHPQLLSQETSYSVAQFPCLY